MSSAASPVSTVGLTEVYTSPDPQVDIVFVHGLNGNPFNTWTADNGVFWPRDLLPKHIGETRCRVLTYGYDARVSAFTDGVGKDTIHHHAENLAARLYSDRSVSRTSSALHKTNAVQSNKAVERPIIFVVHSLGGLVTKQCLIYSRSIDHPNSEHLRSIFVSTYGILFMGTPHLGSDLAKWGTLLQHIASAALPKKFFDSSSHLVEALKTNNETLQNINRGFNEILPRLRVYFFYEGKPMDLKGTRQFVVDEDSAAPNYPGVERMGIERDHSHMCKFEDAQTSGFSVVAEAIDRYSQDASGAIAVRWEQERQVRTFEREMRARELLTEPFHTSRGTSPDSRHTDSRNAPTPLLSSHPRTPILLENGSTTLQPYEIEEHEGNVSPAPGSARLSHRPIADSTNLSSPNVPPSPSVSVPKLIRPMVVAPLGFRPNSHFVGFDIELARMEMKLSDETRAEIGARAVLLYGPPGCGKSHLARQYLWKHVDEYPNGIFWIDCKTPESLVKGFWNVSQSLGLHDQMQSTRTDAFIDAVRVHLAQKEKWLMVFDGLSFDNEQSLESFKRYVPDGKGNSIIYTTVDQTLANRQRLLDPPGIKVYPLTTAQACSLLFKSLHMREDRAPSSTQLRKAKQLVKYYECLPLGIHAAAHALLARQRPLEKFVAGPANQRLSSPFLSILGAMKKTQQVEAVNLLLIMCFLNHEVPVAMLQFGHKALIDAGIEIRSMEHESSTRRELDLSISTLIKNGLVERRLQTYASSSSPNGGRSSPEETRLSRQQSMPISVQDDGDSQSSPSTIVGIDVVRVHTVVQQVYLDNIRSRSTAEFNAWLTIAANFVIGAWNVTLSRMKSHTGRGSVADYREFESHAEKVWSHFPTRPEGVSQELKKARHDLHSTRRMIKREIENQSPSQSSSSSTRQNFASIFERSGSSSDEGPETPTSGLTRKSTWSNDPSAPHSESPVEYQGPTFANLPVLLDNNWYDDAGYLSDDEARVPKERTTSTSTEKAMDERQLALRAIFEGRNKAEVQGYKPTPVVGEVSVTDIPPVHSRSNSATSQVPIRPSSTTSLAEAALTAMHKKSPPSSKSGSRGSPQRGERRPLMELSSNSQIGAQAPPMLRNISASPHLVHAVMANQARRDGPPVEENVSLTRRSKPMMIAGRSFVPTLSTLESHSLPAEYGPVATRMARDPSHESTTSTQTEPVEFANDQSIEDNYLTPMISPTEPRSSPLSVVQRSPNIDSTIAGPQSRTINSLVTQSVPDLIPQIAELDGLGISDEQHHQEDARRE